jgi:hypothetical protein
VNKSITSTSINASQTISRREFLRMGTASAAALLTTVTPFRYLEAAFNPVVDVNLTGKIAVLMPHQGPGHRAYNAFTRVFAAQYPNVELITAEVRPYWSDVTQAAQSIAEAEKVQLIVTLMNPTLSPYARDYFASADNLLIVASAGENIVRHEDHLPNVFHTSLHLWESNYALGQWAVQTYGKRGLMATTLYDSGFDALHAFQMGVEAAGGEIVNTYIDMKNGIDDSFASLRQTLDTAVTNFVFGMSSTPELTAALTEFTSIAKLPLVSSPLADITARYDHLGQETAHLAAAALAAAESASGDMLAVCRSLRSTQNIHPVYQTYGAGLTRPLSASDCDDAVSKISASSVKTGWSTPYLI